MVMQMEKGNYKGKNVIVAGITSKEEQELIKSILAEGADKVVIADIKADVLQSLENNLTVTIQKR